MKSNKYKILFVCLGNICRSPAGEGIMKKIIEENNQTDFIAVDSAGTSGYHDGDLPDRRMRSHGNRRGYKFDSISRKFTADDFDDFDLIIAMDDNNYDNIMKLSPDLESQKKVHRMVYFSKKYGYDHIPDPYYMGADGFELVLDLLEDACEGLYSYLKENQNIR
ncbi:low molecular weight protein-tyrosine-phosphatase [Dysgonomonas capnocytophagoides]|uniref:low molecular weight protein-tyrosine-phosphatase n=1 Tax=Dysgonomonas capnocytophagoides TaxID=45254 RepID=UPI003341AFC7